MFAVMYSEFITLSNIEKISYVLGSKLWAEKDFSLTTVKEFLVNLWDVKLYCKDACPDPQSDFLGWDQSQSGEFRNGMAW